MASSIRPRCEAATASRVRPWRPLGSRVGGAGGNWLVVIAPITIPGRYADVSEDKRPGHRGGISPHGSTPQGDGRRAGARDDRRMDNNVRVAINGFGRIGRQVLRQIARSTPGVDVVVVNSVRAKPDVCAHLFKYDSVFGRYPGSVEHDADNLIID